MLRLTTSRRSIRVRWALAAICASVLAAPVTAASVVSAARPTLTISATTRALHGTSVSLLGGTARRPLAAAQPGDPGDIAERFAEQAAPQLDVDPASDLVQLQQQPLADGGTAVRIGQEYQGVPVLGGQLAVRVARNGSVLSSAGETIDALPPTVDLAASPEVSAATAAGTAVVLTARNDAVDAATLHASTPELMVYDPQLLGVTDDPHGARTVWQVDVRTDLGDVDRFVLIDATTGAIALTFAQVAAAANIQVCDNLQLITSTEPNCTTPVRSTANNVVSSVADVNDAFDNTVATYNFYATVLGRDSVDGLGLPLRSTVRYCPSGQSCPYANAFWNGSQMVYGTGYATADDVVGHELTHGVTDYESGLLYYGESGAINESISDVFGELIDQWNVTAGDSGDARWALGEDLPSGALRSMSDPTFYGDPDKMTSTFYSGALTDEHGVHTNSGVNNKAAFLMADGGTFNNTTIVGLGLTKTAKIYYEAQTSLLTPGSDYLDLYNALQQACANIVGSAGITSSDCAEVTKVVTATEMDKAPITAGSKLTAPICPSGLFQNPVFSDDFETNGPWATTSSAAPNGLWSWSAAASQSGSRSIYGEDLGVAATNEAHMTSPVVIPSGTSYLRFDHSFSFDAEIFSNPASNRFWDGGVVEYSNNGGSTWTDLESMVPNTGDNRVNGYNSTLMLTSSDNPMKGRKAFSGSSAAFQSTRYMIGSLAGQSVQFRFRIGSDSLLGYPGWFIDDLSIYTCGAAPVPAGPPGKPVAVAGSGSAALSWIAPASSGGAVITDYLVERSNDSGSTWSPVAHAPSAATTATVSGLANGMAYVFRVSAITSAGPGAPSPVSDPVVPIAPPSAGALAALPPTLRLADATPALGQSLPISHGGFMPLEWVAVVLESSPRVLATIRADGAGAIAGSVTLPNDVSPGAHHLSLLGVTSGVGFRSAMSVVLSNDGFAYPTGSGFVPLSPVRVFDTRPGEAQGTVNVVKQRYGGGTELRVHVTGTSGVPATGVGAVSLNVTAVDPSGSGFVTVYPCGTRPLASSINYVAGDVIPNAVVAPLSAGGDVCFFSSASTHLLADINGWFASAAGFTAVAPARLFDTRPSEPQGVAPPITKQKYGGATELRVHVTGSGGVPASGVAAVALNVTVVDPAGPGFVTVYPCGTRPTASSLNYVAGQVVANAVIAPVSASGEVCFFSSADTHLLADVTGWFAAASGFVDLTPVRVFDSRPGEAQGAVAIVKRRYGGAAEIRIQITGAAGLPPAGVSTVALNVTVVDPAGPGFITVYPCGARPVASNLNYVAGQIVPNAVIAPVSASGEVCFFSSADTDLLADITGWFTP